MRPPESSDWQGTTWATLSRPRSSDLDPVDVRGRGIMHLTCSSRRPGFAPAISCITIFQTPRMPITLRGLIQHQHPRRDALGGGLILLPVPDVAPEDVDPPAHLTAFARRPCCTSTGAGARGGGEDGDAGAAVVPADLAVHLDLGDHLFRETDGEILLLRNFDRCSGTNYRMGSVNEFSLSSSRRILKLQSEVIDNNIA